MVAGAFAGWLAVYRAAAVGGVVGGGAGGRGFGLLHAWLTVTLALSQHVSGLGITLLATSWLSLRLPGELPQGGQPAHHHARLRRWRGCRCRC
jgi:ABC-type uncharacterized transport system permease subunit